VRESRQVFLAIARQLDEAARAQQHTDAEHWRRELRPRAMRLIAARTRHLAWSRALVSLLLDELQPDDLFTKIVGTPNRLTPSRFPQAVAIALLLRHSWRQVDLTRIARRLGITLTTKTLETIHSNGRDHHVVDSPARLGPVKALRSAPTPTSGAHGLDRALGRARGRHLRDGRHRLTPQKGR
jgi:hypothetical protein